MRLIASAAWLIALIAFVASGRADPPKQARLAVIVGADEGDDDDVPLRYAELDAQRMRDVLTELGDVTTSRAILVHSRRPSDIREAVREVSGRAAELHEAGYRITFLFYYSGHGDEDSLHLSGGHLALSDLRQEIATVPADIRLSILDACRGPGRAKGVSRGDDFQVSVTPRGPHGSVEVRAASDGEIAQESDELHGSVFTHFLLSGLRGDADSDGDRRVTLAELYAYTYRRTLLRTQRGPVTQHATLEVDLQGAGELVLATPASAAATIYVPAGAQRYLIVALPSAAVVGEISGGSTGFAVPAGRYLIVARDRAHTRVAEVDLSHGGSAHIADNQLRDAQREELVARGGLLELRRSRWRAGLTGDFSAAPDKYAGRTMIGYQRLYGPWFWEVDAGGGLGTVDAMSWNGNSRTIVSSGLVGLRWPGRGLELAAAGGVEGRYSWQSLTGIDKMTLQHLHYGALGARAVVRADLALGTHSALSIELGGLAAVRREALSDGSSGSRLKVWWVASPSIAYTGAF